MRANSLRCNTIYCVLLALLNEESLLFSMSKARYIPAMIKRFPPSPPTGKPMLLARPSAEARALLALRRSAGSKMLTSPGPTQTDLDELLAVAARVPDHRKLEPWRFIVFEGEARTKFGAKIEAIYKAEHPNASADNLALERNRFMRSPSVVAVISSPDTAHKTPVWEQELSTGAVCYNLLLAANAAGWAGVWLTEWLAFHDGICQALNLGKDERVAGFIYIGTSKAKSPERPRPNMANKVQRF